VNFKIDEVSEQKPEFKYPALMKSTNTSHVVLFLSAHEGLTLREGGFEQASGDWCSAEDPSEWKPFVGTITVSP
jgi:hypothetical protein